MSETRAAHAEALADGWVALIDPTHGVEYYFNTHTQQSQWERPGSNLSHVTHAAIANEALPEGWVARIDPTHGVEYYFDLVRQCSQWERPTAPAAVPFPSTAKPLQIPNGLSLPTRVRA